MSLVLGLGVSSAASVDAVLSRLPDEPVAVVATLDRKADHPVVVAVAAALGARVVGHPATVLAAQAVTGGSQRALAATGTPSVAEASVLASGGVPLGAPVSQDGATLALGRLVDLAHHGDDEARAAGIRLDLAVNVAVSEPPAVVREAVAASLAGLAAYPDAAPTTARVARHLGVDPDAVLLTNGAAQAFTLVAHARPWRRAVVVHPQFTEPEAALRAAGAPVHRHVLTAPYRLDPAALRRDHPDADLVAVGNPTNPTSVLHPRASVLDARPDGGVLLVDEAFIDTSDDPDESVLPDAARPGSGILVTRSWTKTFGLAGLRAGAVVGDPLLVARLRELAPQWSVSTPALAAVDACCTPWGEAFAREQRDRLQANARFLAAELDALGALAASPQAGFVLAHAPWLPQARAALLDAGIATRSCTSFPGLDATHLRLAARDPAQLEPALAILRAHAEQPDTSNTPRSTPQEQP